MRTGVIGVLSGRDSSWITPWQQRCRDPHLSPIRERWGSRLVLARM